MLRIQLCEMLLLEELARILMAHENPGERSSMMQGILAVRSVKVDSTNGFIARTIGKRGVVVPC